MAGDQATELPEKDTVYLGKLPENGRIVDSFYKLRWGDTGRTAESMPSDESETPQGDDDRSVDVDSESTETADQLRDPETGQFLPNDARPAADTTDDQGVPSDSEDAATEVSTASDGKSTRRRSERTGSRGPVFRPNPGGYPRQAAVYFPALPWLRLPVHHRADFTE